ncbi:hypothetical protein LCGC14_3024200, partial [marine sediment metagenome]
MVDSLDTIPQAHRGKRNLHLHVGKVDEPNSAFQGKAFQGKAFHGKAENTQDVEHALRERLKELNCLYGISRLVEAYENSLEPILKGIVDLLPPSWQYPEGCCARLTLHGEEHATTNFRQTNWSQSAKIRVNGTPAGVVEVCYLREMPELDEGPFLKEERDLINAIAERVGHIVERTEVQRQLATERAALKERVKELNCLYCISRLVEQHHNTLTSILQGIADILPQS